MQCLIHGDVGTWKLSSLILIPEWCCVEWYILSELWMMSSSKGVWRFVCDLLMLHYEQ